MVWCASKSNKMMKLFAVVGGVVGVGRKEQMSIVDGQSVESGLSFVLYLLQEGSTKYKGKRRM